MSLQSLRSSLFVAVLQFLTQCLRQNDVERETIQALSRPIRELAKAGLQSSLLKSMTLQRFEEAFKDINASILPFHKATLLSCVEPLLKNA